jgi:hypothetical protein
MFIQRLIRRFTLMDAATDGTEGGAGGGAPAAAAPEPSILEAMGKGGDPDPAAAAAAAAASAASAAAAPQTAEQQALQASETDTRRPAHVPAKFWDATKGEINHEAWAKSYTGLEQRMKDTGLPPKDATEYKFEPPAGMEAFEPDPDLTAAFRTKAHEMGLTQKQYQAVMAKYAALIPSMAEQMVNLRARQGRGIAEELLQDARAADGERQARVQGVQCLRRRVRHEGDQPHRQHAGGDQDPRQGRPRNAGGSRRRWRLDPRGGKPRRTDGEGFAVLGSEASEARAVKAKVSAHHEAAARQKQRKAA